MILRWMIRNRIALINGSNMAGKSTFLRCIGTNCYWHRQAHRYVLNLSFFTGNAMTSMRITDNLQEETSFYAELKIKRDDRCSQSRPKSDIVIDEMLRAPMLKTVRWDRIHFVKTIDDSTWGWPSLLPTM